MNQELKSAIEFEEANDFCQAFNTYKNLYAKSNSEYDNWKYFYFFLWTCIEDVPGNFAEKINRQTMLPKMFEEGKAHFGNLPDFNFIAGYTASIFPYELGEYEIIKKESHQMLEKATRLEPDNLIYKFAHLSCLGDDSEYEKLKIQVAPKVLEVFRGNGLLNKYFKQVLYRV